MVYDVPHYYMLFVVYGIFTHLIRKEREHGQNCCEPITSFADE